MDYNEEHATEYIYSRLSEDLMVRFEPEHIQLIIQKQCEFEELNGVTSESESIVNYPIDIDEEQMNYYIIHECAKLDVYISYEDLDQIIELEMGYLEEIGCTEDIGVFCN